MPGDCPAVQAKKNPPDGGFPEEKPVRIAEGVRHRAHTRCAYFFLPFLAGAAGAAATTISSTFGATAVARVALVLP